MIVDQGLKIEPATPSPITNNPPRSRLCNNPVQRDP
jgi:hypothetical protein